MSDPVTADPGQLPSPAAPAPPRGYCFVEGSEPFLSTPQECTDAGGDWRPVAEPAAGASGERVG